MHDTLSLLLGLPGLTVAGLIEAVIVIKTLPQYYGSGWNLPAVGAILLANYAVGLFFWTFIYPPLLSPLRNLPGDKSFLPSYLGWMMFTNNPGPEPWDKLRNNFPGEELVNVSQMRDVIAITHPRLLADLLVHRCYDFTKPTKPANFLARIIGWGLILAENDLHKVLRKKSMPVFSARHIKELYPLIMSKATLLMNTLKRDVNSGAKDADVIELSDWAGKVTLDIIGLAGFGQDFNSIENPNHPFQTLYTALLVPSNAKILFGMLSFVFGYDAVKLLPWEETREFKHITTSLDSMSRDMVKERRDTFAKDKASEDQFDLLSLLMKSGEFSEAQLRDQIMTFLAAGHETTASAWSWACYSLAKEPELQEKLRDEITTAFPNGSLPQDATELSSALERLPYLNGVMNETFRLYPTVPATLREAQRDSQIGGHVIPKGTRIIVPIWLVNHSPEAWGPDVEEFKPERWISEGGKPNNHGGSTSNYDFMTFLHGPRSCIGQNFSRAELRCLLATMVTTFRWELAMDDAMVVPRGVITIKPNNGLYLRLTSLDKELAG